MPSIIEKIVKSSGKHSVLAEILTDDKQNYAHLLAKFIIAEQDANKMLVAHTKLCEFLHTYPQIAYQKDSHGKDPVQLLLDHANAQQSQSTAMSNTITMLANTCKNYRLSLDVEKETFFRFGRSYLLPTIKTIIDDESSNLTLSKIMAKKNERNKNFLRLMLDEAFDALLPAASNSSVLSKNSASSSPLSFLASTFSSIFLASVSSSSSATDTATPRKEILSNEQIDIIVGLLIQFPILLGEETDANSVQYFLKNTKTNEIINLLERISKRKDGLVKLLESIGLE